MRTLMVICRGVVLLGASHGVARLFGGPMRKVALVGLCFAIAAANLLVGVLHAGNSFHQELPIFLLIFLLPAGLAVVVNWRFQ